MLGVFFSFHMESKSVVIYEIHNSFAKMSGLPGMRNELKILNFASHIFTPLIFITLFILDYDDAAKQQSVLTTR